MDLGIDDFILNLMKQFHWQIGALLLLIFVVRIFNDYIIPETVRNWKYKKNSDWRQGQELLSRLRELSPADFEKYVVTLFTKLGYIAEHVGHAGDHGLDVKLIKNGAVSYIQCKKYAKNNKVGEAEVREFLGSILTARADGKSFFVTTSIFSLPAQKVAEGHSSIELVDGMSLLQYIRIADGNFVSVQDLSPRMCPACKIGTLVEREGKNGKFIGCSNFPKCRHTETLFV